MHRKMRFDLWTIISLAMLGLYAVFLILPMMNLMTQAVLDKETGQFTLNSFVKFFSTPYYF